MVEIASALAGNLRTGRHGANTSAPGISLAEVTGRDLVQIGVWPDTREQVVQGLSQELGLDLDVDPRRASVVDALTMFQLGPDKLLIAAPLADALFARLSAYFPAAVAVVTELGHSRTVLRIGGPNARDLLARLVAIDLDPSVFGPGSFAATGSHGVSVLLHALEDTAGSLLHDLYLPRSFALSMVEAKVELAEQWCVAVEV